MNVNSLYPVVVDLSDAEYEPQGFCCSQYIFSGGVEFSFNDLMSPAHMPMPHYESQIDRGGVQRTNSGGMSRSRARRPPLASTPLTPEDTRNEYDEAVVDDRRMTFNDCYVLTRQINKGANSVVWECVHRATGQRYAAKIVDRRCLNKKGEQAVYREIHMLSIIDPNISGTIHLHQYFDEPSHVYVLTEYVPGGNLLARIIRKTKLSEMETKSIIRSIVQCLVHHHRNGTAHRNLKPDNILLDGLSGIIADYGLAAQLMYTDTGEVVLFTTRCGTSAYVAPEIVNKQPYDCQVDMWGVGIIAYMCLVGYPPFADDSKQVLFERISKANYTLDPKDWAGISRSAKRFVFNLLNVDPTVRMTADEALQHPWLAEPIEPIPIPPHVEKAAVVPSTPVTVESSEPLKTSTPKKFQRVLSNILGRKKDYGVEKAYDDASATSYNSSTVSSSDVAGRK